MAVITRSTSLRSRAARRASARWAARMPRSDEQSPGSATRRSLMPVRCLIHSSEVSSDAARSSLVTTFAGRWAPKPGDGDRSPEQGSGSTAEHELALDDREGEGAATDEIGPDEGLALALADAAPGARPGASPAARCHPAPPAAGTARRRRPAKRTILPSGLGLARAGRRLRSAPGPRVAARRERPGIRGSGL